MKSKMQRFLLSWGSGMRVLEPEWLRDEIRTVHQKAADQYPV